MESCFTRHFRTTIKTSAMAGITPQAFGVVSEGFSSLVNMKNTSITRVVTFAQKKLNEVTGKKVDAIAAVEASQVDQLTTQVYNIFEALPDDWLRNLPIANTHWLSGTYENHRRKPDWLISHSSAHTFFENKNGFKPDYSNSTLLSVLGRKPHFKANAMLTRNFTKLASKHRILLLEEQANEEPNSASAQAEYLKAIVDEDPEYVIRRVESGKYAMDEDIKLLYFKALVLAEKLSPEDVKATTLRKTQATSASQPSGTEERPLHVVMVPTKGSFFREQFWNTLRFLIGLFLIMSVIEAQLQMKMTTNQKEIAPDNSEKKFKFSDVQGVDEAKQELQEVVEFLRTPEKFQKLGGNLPTGVLLIGPPGTGKTLLARAVAGEADVPFFFCSGSEFDEMFVGVGAARVRNLFAAAKEHSPCIIFIDELDAIGGTRIPNDHQPYSRMTLNQLLVELDGFDKTEGIVVVGATNFPEILDKALTRPGRFDSKVIVPMPDVRGRKEILDLYLSKVPSGEDVDASVLARGTIGFSGADLSNIVNQAAIRAAVEGESYITMKHLEFAKDKIIMGPERKSAVISERNRRLIAYHESGHAVVAINTPDALPVHKATIMPRGSALGMVSQLPERDELSWSKKQLVAKLDVCMGGRVAEELIFGKESVTTGASSDMEQATQIATAMVTQYGMSDKIGTVILSDVSKLSPDTQSTVENEIKGLIKESYERVRSLLTNKSKEHHLLAEALLQYETLDADEVKTVLTGKTLSRAL